MLGYATSIRKHQQHLASSQRLREHSRDLFIYSLPPGRAQGSPVLPATVGERLGPAHLVPHSGKPAWLTLGPVVLLLREWALGWGQNGPFTCLSQRWAGSLPHQGPVSLHDVAQEHQDIPAFPLCCGTRGSSPPRPSLYLYSSSFLHLPVLLPVAIFSFSISVLLLVPPSLSFCASSCPFSLPCCHAVLLLFLSVSHCPSPVHLFFSLSTCPTPQSFFIPSSMPCSPLSQAPTIPHRSDKHCSSNDC